LILLEKTGYKYIELLLLFGAIPILISFSIWPILKIILVLIAIIYCIIVAKKLKLITWKSILYLDFKTYWKNILVSFLIVLAASFIFMYYLYPNDLFIVVKKKPLLWLMILLVYSLFSVLPQELLYRDFFFKRYEDLFEDKYYLIWINLLTFPLAHLFFHNYFVLLVTFIGGIFFTITYYKSRSVMLVSIEHALYGNWLFTIGMGEMLAFPMPN